MAAGKAQEILRRRKEAKQKKMLFVLVPLFLLLLAWQGPKTYKALMGGSAPPAAPTAAPATTDTTASGSAPEPSSAPAPSTATPEPTDTTAAAGSLPNTDPAPPVATGQLVSFSLFSAKNPFLNAGIVPGTQGSSSTSTTTTGTDTTSTGSTTSQPSAHVAVNGTSETLHVGTRFPAGDPLFTVVSIGSGWIKIGLVSGHFLDGSKTEKLPVGKSLTLVKQPDGVGYKITLVSVS